MDQTSRITKCKVNENTLAIKTLKIFAGLELSNQVFACSTFVWAILTPAEPPRAGPYSKPHLFCHTFEDILLRKLRNRL